MQARVKLTTLDAKGVSTTTCPIFVLFEKQNPLTRLRKAGKLEEEGYVLTWAEGQASALSTSEIAKGREVGDVMVRSKDGKPVIFEVVFAFAFHAFTPKGKWMIGKK